MCNGILHQFRLAIDEARSMTPDSVRSAPALTLRYYFQVYFSRVFSEQDIN
ncbi:hypothetical protein ACFLU5_11105 [Bacteroidota bacterium]